MQAISIPVEYSSLELAVGKVTPSGRVNFTFDTENYVSGFSERNKAVACQHHNTISERAYPNDMFTDMARIVCDSCGQTVGYEN